MPTSVFVSACSMWGAIRNARVYEISTIYVDVDRRIVSS